MNNIQHITQGKQVRVSEHQLRRLLEFVSVTSAKFNEIQALTSVVAEKSAECSIAQTLARLASSIANDCRDECLEEFDFFKEHSPELVEVFSEELAA